MKETDSGNMTKAGFLSAVRGFNPQADSGKISKAYDFALQAHKNQKRESGDDFFIHVKECAYHVASFKLETDAICAALLHDVLEDTQTRPEAIRARFGNDVLQLVQGVTKEAGSSGMQEMRAENLRKVLLATAKDIRVIMIKLADRLHNMRTLRYLPVQSQKDIAKETLEIYAPIAYKLGMYRVKSELEDLALKHLQPEIYQQLKKNVSRKREERERQVKRITRALLRVLGEAGISAKVSGRAKNFYSIYKKMMKKSLKFEEIRDLLAFRVVTDTPESCYGALAAIRSRWKIDPEGYSDYIKSPKPNLYQSLHAEIEFDRRPVEIQIRTHEMHHVAEEGIAAHWQYKETERDKKFDRRLSWLKQILDWRQKETAQELVESFKVDIFKDEIYVLTPKGDPIPLPEKASPVDFAYAVHTEVGDHCRAARVNGKMQPLSYELEPGDVVEVITAKNSRPSRAWLNWVKTSFAREKIRHSLGITAEPVKQSRRISSAEGIVQPGDLPLRLQRCCYIRHGESVKGVRVRDCVQVHSGYCEVLRNVAADRKVRLEWRRDETKRQIEISLSDRTGVFSDILGALTRGDILVDSINTKSAKKSLRLILHVSSDEERIKRVLPKLKQVRSVISVRAS